MTEIKESMELGYYFMTLEDKYWGLFLIALIVVFFLLGREKGFWAGYGIASYAFLLCPVTVFFFIKAFPTLQTYYPIRWLCQISLFICLAMTLVMKKVRKEQDKWHFIGAAGILVLMLFLAGTPVFMGENQVFAEKSGVSAEYEETYNIILSDMEKRGIQKAYIWGPKEWMADARVYSGDFYPIYGKDMWDGQAGSGLNSSYSDSLRTLYEFYTMYETVDGALDNKWQQVEVLADTLNATGDVTCDYVVMYRGTGHWKERGKKVEKLSNVDVEGTFLSRNFEKVGMTENYYLFYKQAGE